MRVAVLGLGSAGRRHARLLGELGHDAVGYDPEARPEDVALAPSAEAALDGADAAIVASPNVHHAAQAALALDAGVPVLVEKPLALDAAGAAALADRAAAAGLVAGVAMNLRFHAGILELRRLLEAGTLGAPRTVEAEFGYDLRLWRPGTDYRQSYSAQRALGGGILLDAIHELDYLLWLLGPVDEVAGRLDRLSDLEIDVEDTVLADLAFRSGVRGVARLNFHEPAYRRGCHLVGAEASATWDWNTAEVVVRRDAAQERRAVPCPVQDTYRAELEDFLAAVAEGRPPRTPLADGVAALRVVEALRRADASGGRVAVE